MKEEVVNHSLDEQRDRLRDVVLSKVRSLDDGWKKIPGLDLFVHDVDVSDTNCFYSLSLSLILQGDKLIDIGPKHYSYGAGSMIVTAVDIPTSFRTIGSTREKPFVSLRLRLDPKLLMELMKEMSLKGRQSDSNPNSNAFCIARATSETMSAFERLLRLSENPGHMSMLMHSVIREIHYFALSDPQCENLRELCTFGMPNNRIAKAVDWIKEHFKEPLSIRRLADMAFMASSTFHAHFKSVTSLTPLQYQKRLRLHEARRLIMKNKFSASAAAFEVGYKSVQQFSREYKRLFGISPSKDKNSKTFIS